MTERISGILQLDFDGTLAQGDVSTGILAHFVSPEWAACVEAAGRQLVTDPDSPALVDTMIAGYQKLEASREDCLAFAREHHPARPGLPALIEAAERLGLECHVVSNGFEFYIRDYLRAAGVDGRVEVHCGSEADGKLQYLGPDGVPLRRRYKLSWSKQFLARQNLLIYLGDGASDIAPASLAGIVFARDGLLEGMPQTFGGISHPFETLHDVAKELQAVLGNAGRRVESVSHCYHAQSAALSD